MISEQTVRRALKSWYGGMNIHQICTQTGMSSASVYKYIAAHEAKVERITANLKEPFHAPNPK